jgi:flagellar basal body-associated protein FliL
LAGFIGKDVRVALFPSLLLLACGEEDKTSGQDRDGVAPTELSSNDALEESRRDAPTRSTVIRELGVHHLSLSAPDGDRTLILEIAVEAAPDSIDVIVAREGQVRDGILMLASEYTASDVEDLDGRMRLRDDIHERIRAAVAPHKVARVFYTEFKFESESP